MDNPIEEIKKKVDIVDFIGSFIPLKKAGRNFKALCPFHQEKTPSFIISPERQIWRCFGACQEGGDIFKFLIKWENITFYEALKDLAEKAGVKLKKIDFEDKAWQRREKLFTINSLAAEFYHYLLKSHEIGHKALDYLKGRKINQKIVDAFSLGYAPSSWDSILKFLSKKGYDLEDIHQAGLLVKSDRGGFYDRFRKRLIFPLKDARGNVLGFSGRLLGQEEEAKYINTPETPVYHKRETLFGINLTKDAIKKKNQAVLVEGEFDLISLFQAGIDNVIATKGSAVTKDQLMLIKRFTDRIVLSLDVDQAGAETTKRAIVEAENLDFDIGVVTFDFGKDPDEAIKADPVKFKKLVKKPIPIYDFIIDLALKEYEGKDAYGKKNIGDEVVPFLININNPIVKSYYIKRLAKILEVEEKSVEMLMRREAKKKKSRRKFLPEIKREAKIGRYEMLQKYVLSLIFQSNKPQQLLNKVDKIVDREDFSQTAYGKLFEDFLSFGKKKSQLNIKKFVSLLPKELVPAFDEAFLFDIEIFGEEIKEKSLDKTLWEFKKLALKKRIKDRVSDEKDEEIKKLTAHLQEVEKKLNIL